MTVHADRPTFAQHEPHVDPAPGKVWVIMEPGPRGIGSWFIGVVDHEVRRIAGPNLPVDAIMLARYQDAATVASLLGLDPNGWSAVLMDAPS